MSRSLVLELADCTEFRQTLSARPPQIVHGTALLLTGLLAAAVGWSALAQANLVVLAQGRVRPHEIPTRIFTPSSIEFEGRVVEAPFDEGDVVRRDDVLVRLDTTRIDITIAKLTRTIEAGQQELAKLMGQQMLLSLQSSSAQDKARTELRQAEEALNYATEQRDSEVRQAQAELVAAEDQSQRIRKLSESRVATQQQVIEAEAKFTQAQEKVRQAALPVDGSGVDVARRGLELVERESAVREAELEARIVVKQGEVEALQKDLDNLRVQREAAVLRAPIDGVVVAGRIRVGDVLEPGKPVLELARHESYCFEAAVPSGDIGHLREGMPVRIRFDAYDYQKYGALDGTVSFLSPDSRPIDQATSPDDANAAGNSPVAFVVRVELHGEEVGRGTLRGAVKLGLGGTAEIITDRESLLTILIKRIRRTISLI